jgi:RNA polymerase sigma factor (sigma-70 family)
MSNNKRILFDTIYQQNYPMVLQMCLGYMKGDEDTAKDLNQEVFVNIWSALEKYRGDSSPKTWVYRITVNTCLQHIKREVRKKEVPIEKIEHQLTNESPSQDEKNINNLYKAIGQLEEVDRLIVMMMLEEQEYNDIADVMGINPVNLRVKIHRIKKRLKKILDNE